MSVVFPKVTHNNYEVKLQLLHPVISCITLVWEADVGETCAELEVCVSGCSFRQSASVEPLREHKRRVQDTVTPTAAAHPVTRYTRGRTRTHTHTHASSRSHPTGNTPHTENPSFILLCRSPHFHRSDSELRLLTYFNTIAADSEVCSGMCETIIHVEMRSTGHKFAQGVAVKCMSTCDQSYTIQSLKYFHVAFVMSCFQTCKKKKEKRHHDRNQ